MPNFESVDNIDKPNVPVVSRDAAEAAQAGIQSGIYDITAEDYGQETDAAPEESSTPSVRPSILSDAVEVSVPKELEEPIAASVVFEPALAAAETIAVAEGETIVPVDGNAEAASPPNEPDGNGGDAQSVDTSEGAKEAEADRPSYATPMYTTERAQPGSVESDVQDSGQSSDVDPPERPSDMSEYVDSEQQADQPNDRPDMVYTNVFGNYDALPFAGEVSVEEFLVERIDMLLTESDEPVVAIDVGAGAATTWHKIGGYFRPDIEDGRLLLAAVNREGEPKDYLVAYANYLKELNADPEMDRHALGKLVAGWTEAMWFYKQHGDTVHALKADFSANNRLWQTPSGTGLYRTAQIVHERQSVTAWSDNPRLHCRGVAGLTAPDGVYMLPREDTYNIYGFMNQRERAARIAGIAAVHNTIAEEFTMQRIDVMQEGPLAGQPLDYVMFAGARARAVTVG
ncbi:MAG TPA: hypothetical protein VGO07_03225 [Candidatus Saccharimonadales bacterium]|jgi:hypothetical protein|nr:hypothetical protein [Candidatus Saccharimonadales bacterium]